VIVLDTSSFIAGYDAFGANEEQFTAPNVEGEMKANSMNLVRFQAALESGKVKIKAPSEQFLKQVQETASKVGDSYLLSETDMQLLALALEFKVNGSAPQIVTDDYSIQNVATKLGIDFKALATFGIKKLLEWIRYCPACHREYPVNCKTTECQICGTELKRKPKRTAKQLNARR
jgi:endoribonuclease Nob1